MRRKVNRLISSGVDFEPKLVWGDLHQQKEVRLGFADHFYYSDGLQLQI